MQTKTCKTFSKNDFFLVIKIMEMLFSFNFRAGFSKYDTSYTTETTISADLNRKNIQIVSKL